MNLPNFLLLSLPLLLTTYYLLLAAPAAYAQEEPESEVIGTIPTEEEEPDVYSREITEDIPADSRPPVGVETDQPNQLQFPNFQELTNTTDNAMPFLLPADLLKDLTPREDLEKKLKGKIFHPVCRVNNRKPEERITGKTSNIDTPEWWPVALARTKLAQAIGVPGFKSWVEFQTAEGEADKFKEDENDPIDCKTILAVNDNQAEPETSKDHSEVFPGILGWVQDLIRNILSKFGFIPDVTVQVHPKKFLQGESEFANQAGRKMGFLRAFAPNSLLPEESKFDGEVETPYKRLGKKAKTDINYQGVAGARVGYTRLQESLYPAELQGLRPIPQTPPLPNQPGTGIFELTGNPNSAQFTTLVNEAASAFNVPPAILAAVAWIEGGHMWGYSDSQIATYSAPGGRDPQNARPNGCGARGPMQFLNDGIARDCQDRTGQKMDDVWAGFANAVNEATGENRTPNIDNIKDSLYAAARKLWKDSKASSNNWNQEQVYRAGSGYLGSCTTVYVRLGNRTYCDYLWDNYK